ncbi:peptide transporter family 1-like [Actinia tenebrosa]|uniref:Peptide transporter family 1-like n=1 Tax=Actinia tenebrosa TaxID=6105 RepID=A0A6P8JDZ4_ACTTE|nr:peptide transporter family 1-like [Actinia tenebrosa]XP_031574672.1 peptide transporter family 1-like [Actinia tenebrosa]
MDISRSGEANTSDGSDIFVSPSMPQVEVQNPPKLSGKAWGRIRKFVLCKTRFPRSIYFIVGNEFCERFSYYGMKAILFMYLTRVLKFSNNTGTAVFHTFSMLCYFTPLFGAMLADGWIGKYRTILYVSLIYALGNLVVSMTALPPLGMGEAAGPMIGLLLIAIGTGGIKPCVSAFGGDQFPSDQEHLLQSFFSVFYFAINAGSLSSMLLTPVLRGDVQCFRDDCYSLAFGIPALLMLLAIALFWAGRHGYKRRPPSGNIVWLVVKATCYALKKKISIKGVNTKPHWMDLADDKYDIQLIDDIKAMYRVLFMFLPLPVFWTLFDQQGSRWVQQALQMDGDIGVLGTIKPDQMQALNAVFIILLIPVFEGIIYPLVKKPRPLKRMAIGMMLGALAFVIAGLVQLKIQASEMVITPPPSGFADVYLVNTASCNVLASIQNRSIGVKPLGKSTKLRLNLKKNITLGVKMTCNKGLQRNFTFKVNEGRFYDILFGYHDNELIGHLVEQDFTSPPPPGESEICAVSIASGDTFYSLQLDGQTRMSNITAMGNLKCTTVPAKKYKLSIKNQDSKIASNNEVILQNGGTKVAVLKDSGGNGTRDVFIYEEFDPQSISMLWQIPQYFVITSGEIMFSITGLEFAYSQAPASMKSCLQAAWLITVAIGNLIVVMEAESRIIDTLSTEFFFFAAMLGVVMVAFSVMSLFYKYVEKTEDETVGDDTEGIIDMDELKTT